MLTRQILALACALWMVACAAASAGVKIQEIQSPGGISAWLVEERSIPFIAVEIMFRGGSSLDIPSKRGAAYLMTGLLEEGAGDLDAQEFAKAREELAASFEFDIHRDAVTISAQMLTENMEEAADLLRLAMAEPRFDKEALERVRKQVIAIIKSNQTDPEEIASERFWKLAFGGHPYGSPQEGDLETVRALSREDMIEARKRTMARDQLVVAIVGDISAGEAGKLLDRMLEGLPEKGAPGPGRVDQDLAGGVTVVDFDIPQSVALFGHEGLKRNDPDFLTAYVLNHILGGGGFESRLMREVRSERGLTYGIGTYLVPYDLDEMYLGQFSSANGKVSEAIEVVREEWRKAAENGVSEEDLEQAKKFLTGAFPLRFDGNGKIARMLAGMQISDIPISYLDSRNRLVSEITVEDVKRVARRLLKPDSLRFVVVGQPVGL